MGNICSRDRFNGAMKTEIRREMKEKLEQLFMVQEELTDKLMVKFSDDEFRKLNIINHHIEVTASRLRGEWLYGSFPTLPELSKSR